jgi:hypothetical protein
MRPLSGDQNMVAGTELSVIAPDPKAGHASEE